MERRGEPRFDVAASANIRLLQDPSRRIPCNIVNVSANGMRVLAEESLPLGRFLILEMEHHLVALQTANLEAVGDKFAICLQHYGSGPHLCCHSASDNG